jgi:2-oxoglutarate ferredoxin oxidoreductase subunit delta
VPNYIVIDRERCKGCELCVHACPQLIIVMSNDTTNKQGIHPARPSDPEGQCTACALCYQVCPDVCITVYRDKNQKVSEQVE